jgi:hypothetical protein
MWRSLVARTLGVREVAGSNPVIPTILRLSIKGSKAFSLFTALKFFSWSDMPVAQFNFWNFFFLLDEIGVKVSSQAASYANYDRNHLPGQRRDIAAPNG